MRTISTELEDLWLSGDYTGDDRPVQRFTIAKWHMFQTDYKIGANRSTTWQHRGHLNSSLFNQTGPVRELFNVKSFKRSVGTATDAGSATLVLYNVQWRKDVLNPHAEEFDFPGWYTPTRGGENPWDYESNGWRSWLLPDRLIKSFEGYGVDQTVAPEDDEHMYPSGVWLIDEADFSVDGIITLTLRDFGRLLLDQIMYPPVVPWEAYPLYWEAEKMVDAPDKLVPAGEWLTPTYDKDSNQFFENEGVVLYHDGLQSAVNVDDGSVHGHLGEDAFDGNVNSHFLSAGSAYPGEMSYVQGTMDSTNVTGVRVRFRGGPYRVYISLFSDGTNDWVGSNKIPFAQADDGPGMDAHIPYVKSFVWKKGDGQEFDLKRTYTDITKIRITIASRWDSGIGAERFWRGAIREVGYATESETFTPGTQVPQGNYADYTDIIKWLCGWAGFHWPENATLKTVTDTRDKHNGGSPVLPKGAVWGDLMPVKTTGIVKLEESMWDKKPLRDGISSIQEITGFDFWIDETGGAIWRLPNVWTKGNWINPRDGGPNVTRTTDVITIDERTTLIDLGVKLSSRNVRERIFVADANGQNGAVVRGYNPAPTGMHRVGGWTDSHFKSRQETRRMADLIAIRQSYLYRQNTITIAANPAIQIDDQVLIQERMTGEYYLHRITGLSSDFDYENGKWTYQLTTAWLGKDAFTTDSWRPKISDTTKQYLETLGAV